jgi:serine/threonine protein kinase
MSPVIVELVLSELRLGTDVATGEALILVSAGAARSDDCNWLIAVEGGHGAAHQVFAMMSAAGGVRSDFTACYKLGKSLGSSSHAIVYAAESLSGKAKSKGLTVHAAKVPIIDKLVCKQESLKRWQNELKTLIQCQGHPNVIGFPAIFRIRDTQHLASEVDEKPQWAMVMDYCSGGDLFNLVVNERGLTERYAKKIIRGVLNGLTHVHSSGCIHRDVKAENVLLTKEGRPVLADFGIACRLIDGDLLQSCGTPGYVAPEILTGKPCSAAADVFSAGALLHFSLSMQTPFKGATPTETNQRTLQGKVDFSVRPIFSLVSDECKNFILRLLRSSVEERPTADEATHDVWFGRRLRSMAMLECGAVDSPGHDDVIEQRLSAPLPAKQISADSEAPASSRWRMATGMMRSLTPRKLRQPLPRPGSLNVGNTPAEMDNQDMKQPRRHLASFAPFQTAWTHQQTPTISSMSSLEEPPLAVEKPVFGAWFRSRSTGATRSGEADGSSSKASGSISRRSFMSPQVSSHVCHLRSPRACAQG